MVLLFKVSSLSVWPITDPSAGRPSPSAWSFDMGFPHKKPQSLSWVHSYYNKTKPTSKSWCWTHKQLHFQLVPTLQSPRQRWSSTSSEDVLWKWSATIRQRHPPWRLVRPRPPSSKLRCQPKRPINPSTLTLNVTRSTFTISYVRKIARTCGIPSKTAVVFAEPLKH